MPAQTYSNVQNPRIFHSHGAVYFIMGTALVAGERVPVTSRKTVYLHRDEIWRAEAVTPNQDEPAKPHQTGFFTKVEAEQLLRKVQNPISSIGNAFAGLCLANH